MSKITQTSVSELCNHLCLKGEKPSVRKIQEKLGGSFTTISEYLKQWRKETELASQTTIDISPELKNALFAEFAKVANQAEARLQKKIEEIESDNKELEEELKKINDALLQQTQAHEKTQKTLEDERVGKAELTAVSNSVIDNLKNEKKELQQLLNEANEKRHQAELREAVANTKVEAIEKQYKDSKPKK